MRKLSLVLFAMLSFAFNNIGFSQEKNFTIDKLSIEGRADFDYFNENKSSTSGIDGKYFNFEMKGSFLQDFSYRVRQRIDMYKGSSKTDFMILSYHANKNWSLTAGKMPLAVGGWEYDLAPIDVYYASYFWNTFDCYDVGGQVEFHTNDGNHDIIFQVTNSTFTKEKFQNMYAYNLIWYGRMGCFTTSYSINMMEQRKGQFINYIALGNMFDLGRFDFYVDFMNRGFFNQSDFFLGDFSVIGEAKYAFTDKFTGIVKGGYDRNKHSYVEYKDGHPQYIPFDYTVTPGVEYSFAGLGFESYPYKGNQNVRLHGFFALNKLGSLYDFAGLDLAPVESKLTYQFNLGVTWRINFAK
ncbi:MAG: hypothetical protein IKW51_03055 [Bacteroidales bacterium]|nr:hypothetical protein [Bacteroidales bacterium]